MNAPCSEARKAAGSGSRAGRVRHSGLKEAARGWGDATEFESILVSKALPDREFRQNPVIDAHRYMTSLQPCAWSYLRRHPFFKSEVPTRVVAIGQLTRRRWPSKT